MKKRLTITATLIYTLSSCTLGLGDGGPLNIWDYDGYGDYLTEQYISNPLDITRSMIALDDYIGLSDTEKAKDTTFTLILDMGNGFYEYIFRSKGSTVKCKVDTRNSRLDDKEAWSCQASVTPVDYSAYSRMYVSEFKYDGNNYFLTGENEQFEARFISEDTRGLQRWTAKCNGTDFSEAREGISAIFTSDDSINIAEYINDRGILKAYEGYITYTIYYKEGFIKKYTYKLIP